MHGRARLTRLPSQVSVPPLPSPMRTNFINRVPMSSSVGVSTQSVCFRYALRSTDIMHREPQFAWNETSRDSNEKPLKALAPNVVPLSSTLRRINGGAAEVSKDVDCDKNFGDAMEEKTASWRPKHYGNVTFGPRNYPYPISRWLGRRFQMKKHRILKRMRFRRYKLAAVANMPFAKMIRVGMLPELKSSKAKKADEVDASLGSMLVGATKAASGGKQAGRRSRPKSKYQA